jgi:predicted kinase
MSTEALAPVRTFVVVTGLAGSGKTTVAEPLAAALGVRYVSKDAIKEALFDVVGYGGWQLSKTLSRAADIALVRIAQDLDGAVLDNFWDRETVEELLAPLVGRTVEVCCRCRPAVAFRRFTSRSRHPGHADRENREEVESFLAYAERLPIGTLGPVLWVDGEQHTDIGDLARRVRAAAQS